jgi:hypothetical protein
MTEDHYAQSLQASLDDTVSMSPGKYSFEPESGKDYLGMIRLKKTGATLKVYDGAGLGPDLHAITTARFLFFWVLAFSVWNKERIYRPVKLHELYSMWDYEGKLESKHVPFKESMFVLLHRLMSPPGKLVRATALLFCQRRVDHSLLFLPFTLKINNSKCSGTLSTQPTQSFSPKSIMPFSSPRRHRCKAMPHPSLTDLSRHRRYSKSPRCTYPKHHPNHVAVPCLYRRNA